MNTKSMRCLISSPVSHSLHVRIKKRMKKKGHESSTHGGHPLLKVKTEQVELESDGQQGEVVVSGHGNSTSETAYDRALMVQYKLESAHPSFIKLLSNTEANCSLLGIPMIFAARHIPHKFTWLVLEDESGCSQKVCYLPHRRMLSAGWSRFYQLHCLKEGDALVFQLVEPSKFKVYILKEDKHPEIKEVHGNGDVDAGVQEFAVVDEPAKRKCMNNPPSPNLEKKNKTSHQEDHVVVEVPASFDPKDINKFEISANGKVFNLHFSKETKQKYYNLCCSQTTLLHANLIEGLGDAMIITAISETVRVADAIKSSTLTTTKDEFSALDRTLESFEVLGMRVGFLREWIKKLVNFSFESEDYGLVNLMYVEAVTNRSRVLEEIRNLEIRILELEEANAKFEGEIMRLNSKTEAREVEFRAMVKSFGSW